MLLVGNDSREVLEIKSQGGVILDKRGVEFKSQNSNGKLKGMNVDSSCFECNFGNVKE